MPDGEDPLAGAFDDIQQGCFGSLVLLITGLVALALGIFGLTRLIT